MQLSSSGMNLFETILARRSVRSYRKDAIERKTVDSLLEAAVRAPTALHQEPWAFVLVQDRALLHQLSERTKPLFAEQLRRAGRAPDEGAAATLADPEFNVFYDAGTLIVICARPSGPFAVADCWLAAENLMLAACAMGLGSCVIGCAVAALEMPEIKARLGIPGEYTVVAPIIIGHPRGETPASPRREPQLLAWHRGD